MSELITRPAVPDDAASMARVAFDSGFEPWTETRFREQLAVDHTRAFVALSKRIVGLAIGWQVMGELELHLLVVDPNARRHGIGRALLRAFEGDAPVVDLEVSERNIAALELYRRHGFEEVGRRPSYYGPEHAAVLMRHIRR